MKVAKYKLKLKGKDETYTRYSIEGLKMAYHKKCYENDRNDFGGACGLLKNSDYPGYCVLCMTYHKMESDEFPEPGYIVEFSPLYNENMEVILIEYDKDEVFTCIDRGGYKDYDTGKIVDATLTVWNNGAFNEFTKE